MNSNKISARAFGIAFLIGYLSYGLGFGFLNTIINSPNYLLEVFKFKNMVIFEAAILMAVFAPINIVLAIIMLPIFKPFNPKMAYGYLSSAIVSSVLLIIGAIFLLVLVPLSEAYVKDTNIDKMPFELLGKLCKKANFYSYQIAMVIWGFGGLIFCYMLYMTKLVPNWMSIWGFIGYIIFISGAFFAIFGINIDVILDIPGGLFEIFLSFWLIIKGFKMPSQQVIS